MLLPDNQGQCEHGQPHYLRKLTAQHLPYLYEIRFSVEENLLHPHQIQYLQRTQALEDINQGGGWICKYGDDYAGVGFGLFIPEPLIGGLFVKPEYQSLGIGSALLARVTARMFEHGAEAIHLTTDPAPKPKAFINITVGPWSGRMSSARPNW